MSRTNDSKKTQGNLKYGFYSLSERNGIRVTGRRVVTIGECRICGNTTTAKK